MEIQKAAQGARRGAYVRCSPELKPAIVAECLALGASVAAAALAHGVNANLVRKWIEKARPLTKAEAEAEADVSWFSVVPDPSLQPHRDALIHHSDRGSHGERCYHQLSVRHSSSPTPVQAQQGRRSLPIRLLIELGIKVSAP